MILGLLVWAILGTIVSGYYLIQYNNYRSQYSNLIDQFTEHRNIEANVLIGYGNGTNVWYNNTVLPLGSTAFTAIYYLAENINYTDYWGELGILVTSVNGVANNSTHGWFYWRWDPDGGKWILPEFSSAKHILHEGAVLAFTYNTYLEWPPATPT